MYNWWNERTTWIPCRKAVGKKTYYKLKRIQMKIVTSGGNFPGDIIRRSVFFVFFCKISYGFKSNKSYKDDTSCVDVRMSFLAIPAWIQPSWTIEVFSASVPLLTAITKSFKPPTRRSRRVKKFTNVRGRWKLLERFQILSLVKLMRVQYWVFT